MFSKYWIIWNELHKVKGKRCSQTNCRSSQGYDRKSVEWKASMPEMVLVTQSHFCNVFSTQPGIFDITEWFDVFVWVLCSFAIDAINSKKKYVNRCGEEAFCWNRNGAIYTHWFLKPEPIWRTSYSTVYSSRVKLGWSFHNGCFHSGFHRIYFIAR